MPATHYESNWRLCFYHRPTDWSPGGAEPEDDDDELKPFQVRKSDPLKITNAQELYYIESLK